MRQNHNDKKIFYQMCEYICSHTESESVKGGFSVESELERYKLVDAFLIKAAKDVRNVQKTKSRYYAIPNKLSSTFTRFVMRGISNRTFCDDKNSTFLEDPFFFIPTERETESFYRDLNHGNVKDLTDDSLNISKFFRESLEKMKKLSASPLKMHRNDYDEHVLFSVFERGVPHTFRINRDLYEKLKERFTLPPEQYDRAVLALHIRYQTLQINANQFAVDTRYKDELKTFGFDFECFASPFNAYLGNYCSMFHDLDNYFGSKGDFFSLDIEEGMYMANPPYDEDLLANMYEKVKRSLGSAKPVAFLMSIPKWTDYDLEIRIEKEKLYEAHALKFENFHNPHNKMKMIPIPPYISYLFWNEAFAKKKENDLESLRNTFLSFKNMKS